jgi:hypothetical protein
MPRVTGIKTPFWAPDGAGTGSTQTAGAGTQTQTGQATSDVGAGAGATQTAADQTPANWDEYLKTLPDPIKGLYEQHTTSLKTALASERTQRGDLAKQLREASAKAEKGSEMEKALTEIGGKLELAERRAGFYEEATQPALACSNARLAFLVAQEIGAIDGRGKINWDAIKTAAPELFRKVVPPGNAGEGTGNKPPPAANMNSFIRRAAGREG